MRTIRSVSPETWPHILKELRTRLKNKKKAVSLRKQFSELNLGIINRLKIIKCYEIRSAIYLSYSLTLYRIYRYNSADQLSHIRSYLRGLLRLSSLARLLASDHSRGVNITIIVLYPIVILVSSLLVTSSPLIAPLLSRSFALKAQSIRLILLIH